jgi:glycosyltransferase involved in cell wall biosynthesis
VKRRVLQFIGSFNQGGSERQAVGLTRMLHDEGSFEVFAATLNHEGVLRADIDAIGLPEIPEFPLTSFYNANFVTQVRRCADYLREKRIDLIHTHDFYTNVIGMAAATLAGVKARVASKRETGGMRSRSQQFVEKLAFGRADRIVVNSDAVRDHLTGQGIAAKKVNLIYNGIETGRFKAAAGDRGAVCRKFDLPVCDNLRFIAMVANLRHDVKNVPMLLRTAKRLVESQKPVHFVVAGEGELLTGLKTSAAQLGVGGHVHFIGRCEDVPALLSIAEVCVLTSSAEGFSNSILEYMAAGKPVVATAVGGAAEAITDGETGYTVASDDDEAMAARLAELLDDNELAARFGAAARRVVSERFSSGAQLKSTVSLYNSLLDR